MALTPQERNNLIKVGIIVLAVVAASIFAPGFGVNDTRTKIAALDKKLAEAEKTLADMKETAGRLKSLQDQYNRLRPEIEAQERRLPRTSNYDELFRHLNMLGAKNNIRFDALEGITDAARAGVRGEAQEDKGYEKIAMKINLRVDYHGLGRFINDVENGERFMRVDGLVINNGEDRTLANRDWSVQNVEMQLATFRFVEASKTPAAGAAAKPTPTPAAR